MRNKKFSFSVNGKGYYIALILCAVAIGICGYLYYRNANRIDAQMNTPDVTVGVTTPSVQQDVQVVATQPQVTLPEPSETTKPAAPKSGKPEKTASPVEGQTVAVYAMDKLSYNQTTRDWRTHNGVDIAAEAGTAVCAAAEGTVYAVYEDDTLGTTVVIQHSGGYVTRYASLSEEVSVAPGEAVQLGQRIGCVGNSALLETAIGDHVHFSVTCEGEPVDPAEFLGQ